MPRGFNSPPQRFPIGLPVFIFCKGGGTPLPPTEYFFKPMRPPLPGGGGVWWRPPPPSGRIRPPYSMPGRRGFFLIPSEVHAKREENACAIMYVTQSWGGGSAGDPPSRNFLKGGDPPQPHWRGVGVPPSHKSRHGKRDEHKILSTSARLSATAGFPYQ